MTVKGLKKLSAVVMAAYILSILAFYFIGGDQLRFRGTLSEAVSPMSAVGEIVAGTEVEQRFTASGDALSHVQLFFSNYGRENTCHVRAEVLSADGTVLGASEIAADTAEDNRWTILPFPEDIPLRRGEPYTLRVTSPDGTAGNALTVYNLASGNPLPDGTYEFSVHDYLDTVAAAPNSYDADLVALCKAMSDYGHYAQIQQNYDLEHSFSTVYFQDQIAQVSAEEVPAYTFSNGTNVTFIGASLLMKSETVIRAYFTIKGSAEGWTAKVDNNPVELQHRSGNTYYVELGGIHSKDLGEGHSFTVSKGADSAALSGYSVYSYVRQVLSIYANSTTENEINLVNVVKALKFYGQKASVYFSH